MATSCRSLSPSLALGLSSLFLGLALTAEAAWAAAPYTFTSIAKSPSSSFGDLPGVPPGINAGGVVVFQSSGLGTQGFFTGDGGSPRTLALFPDDLGGFGPAPAISNSGLVSFTGRRPGEIADGIFVIDGLGSLTKIVDDSGGFSVPGGNIVGLPAGCRPSGCDIANDGTVIFTATRAPGRLNTLGIYTGRGGALLPFVEEGTPLGIVIDPDKASPRINNAGLRAAIVGQLFSGETIVTGDASGNLNTIPGVATVTSEFSSLTALSLNVGGTVAFSAVKDSGETGIFLSAGGPITTYVDSAGPFKEVSFPAINNFERVAFIGELDQGNARGIFVGPDPVLDKVVAVGDRLFDRTVVFVSIGHDSLNAGGKIAFYVQFAEEGSEGIGTERIIRANPKLGFAPVPELLDRFAQLTTGEGTGIGMSQLIDTPDGLFDLSFDLEFLTKIGELSVMLGERVLGTFDPADSGLIVFEDIDPFSLFPPGPALPATVLLQFLLSGPPGSTARIDDIGLPGLFNGGFQIGYFDGWDFDTSRGGAAIVSAFNTVPGPRPLWLLAVGLAGLGARAWRRR